MPIGTWLTEAMLKVYFGVMLGGCAGVAARLWLSTVLAVRYGESFPVGTLVVNVLGCFVIGVFAILTGPGGVLTIPPVVQKAVTIGVLGGFTTFSSFSLQTINMLKNDQFFPAMLNVGASVIGCLLATWVGMLAGTWLNSR